MCHVDEERRVHLVRHLLVALGAFIRGNLFFFSLTSTKITTQFILISNIKTFV